MKRYAGAGALAALVSLALALPAQANWSQQASGTTETVRDVECPTADHCVAVGTAGTILTTTDGGASWQPRSSGTTLTFYSVSCASESVCMAAGDNGLIKGTTNGGVNWSTRASSGNLLFEIDCPSTTTCWAVGASGTIRTTSDGGSSWSSQSSGTTTSLFGVDCPSTAECYAVGDAGLILRKVANSAWTPTPSGVTDKRLDGVSCPAETVCRVTGEGGTILTTESGGSVWTRQPTPFGHYFFDVECPTANVCWAVGSAGTIIGTVDGGVHWDPEDSGGVTTTLTGVACGGAAACKATGDAGVILTRGGTATGHSSADCAGAPGSTTVAEGYAGDAFVRIRTARPSASRTWVCYRIDNGTSIQQGGLIEVETDVRAAAPAVDTQADDCSTSTINFVPGPHPLIQASVGDPSEPVFVPIMVDTLRNNEAAWVCIRAGGIARRVVVTLPDVEVPTVTVFPDPVGATPPPDEPPAGLPSSSCQTSGGRRVLNMDVATSHVWLYTQQPALNQANVCVRTEGPLSVGGVLGIKAQIGLPVTVTRSSDTSPCTVSVLDVASPAALKVSRTPTGSLPASVCVKTDSVSERVTLDAGGSLILPIPTWTPDPGTPGS